MFPFTFQVTPYDFTKNNVKITVFDTPGLADGTGNDERYLRQILEKVKTVDLFLFCTDMTCKRFSDDDARTIAKLTKTFGTSLWDHALVVFTFANQFNLDASEKDHTDVHLVQQRISCFQKRMQSFQEKIQNSLLSEGVSQDAASNLPFAPAGELKEPRLPDRENWLTGLWIAAFKCISRNAKAHFLMANLDRILISCGGLLSEYENRAETDRTRRGGEREGSKENGIDQDKFWSEGLKRSSPVISTSEGKHWKHFREKLKTIKCKTLTLTAGENNNNDTLHGHQDVNEPKRGSLKRSSALVSRDAPDLLSARMRQRKSSQGFTGGKDSETEPTDTRYKCRVIGEDCAEADWHGENGDDGLSRFNRLSVAELETEQHCYSPHDCQNLYSLPPAYDEVVRNRVSLPMDEASSQELFKEIVREATSTDQTCQFVGTSARQSGFVDIYAAFFAKIVEFVKRLLRGKKTAEAKMPKGRQKEDADKL